MISGKVCVAPDHLRTRPASHLLQDVQRRAALHMPAGMRRARSSPEQTQRAGIGRIKPGSANIAPHIPRSRSRGVIQMAPPDQRLGLPTVAGAPYGTGDLRPSIQIQGRHYLACMNFSRHHQHETNAASHSSAARHIRSFIEAKSFPCVGAKSALNKDRLHVDAFGPLGSTQGTERLWDALKEYSDNYQDPGQTPVSFIAMFDEAELDELGFERLMWAQLQALHELDCSKGFEWDRKVSGDPGRAEFSFSVAGRAFFVVGLHPGASRKARQTPFPCLVFNFHDQFEDLKASGKYSSMQTAIRKRDTALQGSVNPMLSRFGEASEAIQYSGRAVQHGWQCPFHKRETENA